MNVLSEPYDTANSLEIKHRIDSPLPQNAKPLLNKDLPQAGNGAYKPAYKQTEKSPQMRSKNCTLIWWKL